MNKKSDKKKSNPSLLWGIIDTFVNILIAIAIIIILAGDVNKMILNIFIIIFIVWAFRPMYLYLKEYNKK